MKIPMGISDSVRSVAGRPDILVWNGFFEQSPVNLEDGVSIVRRPAFRELLVVGDGPIRKIYYRRDLFNNDFFVVSADALFRVTRTADETFSTTEIDNGLDDEFEPSLAATDTNLFITDQVSLYHTNGTASLTPVVTPDDVPISKLLYIGGYVICVVKDSQRFYWIQPGETEIDALDFAEAEGSPDRIVDALVLGDQIYFFGGGTLEMWSLSGDAEAPFQRIQGRLMETGAVAGSATTIPNQDTLFFIAADGTARVGPGLDIVSDSGVEERLRRAIRAYNLANL